MGSVSLHFYSFILLQCSKWSFCHIDICIFIAFPLSYNKSFPSPLFAHPLVLLSTFLAHSPLHENSFGDIMFLYIIIIIIILKSMLVLLYFFTWTKIY
jgi:hypothetical protein